MNDIYARAMTQQLTASLAQIATNAKNPPNGLTACKGDGVTDDSAALQAIINYANTNKLEVYLPPGTYIISSTLLLGTSTKLRGAGLRKTFIQTSGAITALNTNGTSASGGGVYWWEISDLSILGNNVGTVGLQMDYSHEGSMINCLVTNFQKGIVLNNSYSNGFINNRIVNNTDTNMELGAQSNDITIIDCQLDYGGNYGLHITADSQSVSIVGGVIQYCGKDGIRANAGRGININGLYCENNNSSNTANCADINLIGDTYPIEGVSLVGLQLWTKTVGVGILLDHVVGCAIIGGAINLVSGGTTQYSIQTTANTQNVYTLGNYRDQSVNDVGNALTTMDNPVFKKNIGVKKNSSNIYSDTLDSTTPTTFQQYIAGVLKTELKTDVDGQLYLSHLNTSNSTMEVAMSLSNTNRLKIYKTTDMQKNMLVNIVPENGVTASRPTSPVVGQQYYDTTLNKPIWCKVGGASPTWVDATGTTV